MERLSCVLNSLVVFVIGIFFPFLNIWENEKCPPNLAGILSPRYGYGEILKKQANCRTIPFQKTGQTAVECSPPNISHGIVCPTSEDVVFYASLAAIILLLSVGVASQPFQQIMLHHQLSSSNPQSGKIRAVQQVVCPGFGKKSCRSCRSATILSYFILALPQLLT